MRVVFFGTPEFAVPSLEAVLARSEVVGVVSQPDRPRGRGLRVQPPPLAEAAFRYGLNVRQPASLRDPAVLLWLRDLAPDLLVVVAYGRFIPREVLETARLGGINVHPSLLPRYRGPAPIPRAIAAGETETGVTVLYVTEEVDAGDIILQRAVPIGPEDTSGTLARRLAQEGAALLAEALPLLEAGRAPRRPQDPHQATYAPKVTRDEGWIRWTEPAVRIANLVRAFNPWPGAYTVYDGERLLIWRAAAWPDEPEGDRPPPGTVLRADDRREPALVVAAGQGALAIHEVQPPSGRRMPAGAYLRGHPLRRGTVLGSPP